MYIFYTSYLYLRNVKSSQTYNFYTLGKTLLCLANGKMIRTIKNGSIITVVAIGITIAIKNGIGIFINSMMRGE